MRGLIELALILAVIGLAALGLLRVARELIRPPLLLVRPDSEDEEE
jgi:hypothetical protein